jgi:hypothetical protein
MAASAEDISRWIKQAKKDKMKFIISVCDTFDWDDYPVYCKDEKELLEKRIEYSGKSMQRINEVITINENGSVDEPIRKNNVTVKNSIFEELDAISELSEILKNQIGPRNDEKIQTRIKRIKTLLR